MSKTITVHFLTKRESSASKAFKLTLWGDKLSAKEL